VIGFVEIGGNWRIAVGEFKVAMDDEEYAELCKRCDGPAEECEFCGLATDELVRRVAWTPILDCSEEQRIKESHQFAALRDRVRMCAEAYSRSVEEATAALTEAVSRKYS
jgi:hypothetical protein